MSHGITGHMIVKNEDQWVWFAIHSVLPYLDQLLITDTGSVDNTIKIIKQIDSPKILFKQVIASTRDQVTAIRQQQLEATSTPWVWLVDGDEIYPTKLATEIVAKTHTEKSVIVVRRYDLIGDIYHAQHESVGSYSLYGESGHLLVRLMNKDLIHGLHVKGDYPQEGYFDGSGNSILGLDRQKVSVTHEHLYHAMYLKRSSAGSNLRDMFNRSKYKIESGIVINDTLPEVFSLPRPSIVPDPLVRRSLSYELLARIITPIKQFKRQLT